MTLVNWCCMCKMEESTRHLFIHNYVVQSPGSLVFNSFWGCMVLAKVAEGNLDSLFLATINYSWEGFCFLGAWVLFPFLFPCYLVFSSSSFGNSLYNSHVLELCSILAIFLINFSLLITKVNTFSFKKNMGHNTAFLRILA